MSQTIQWQCDIIDKLEEIGYSLRRNGGHRYRTQAIYRGGDGFNLSIDLNKNTFYDFVTQAGGSIEELIALTLNLSEEETQQWLADRSIKFIKRSIPKSKIKMPEFYDEELLLKLKQDHSYWIGRGISEETIKKFGGGIADTGQMKGRYVFPIRGQKKRLIGFSGRLLQNSDKAPKWKHVGKTHDWYFPYYLSKDQIQQKKEVILVESIGDCLALYNAGIENVLVVFGLHAGRVIKKCLLYCNPDKIYIAFNNDDNRRGESGARKVKEQLKTFFQWDNIIISLPKKNDFGEMNKREIHEWHENR